MEIFKVFGSVYMKTDEADKGLDRIKRSGKETASIFGKIPGPVKAAGVALAGVFAGGAIINGVKNLATGIFDLSKNAAAFADNVLTLSAKTDISTSTLQKFEYATELVDVSVKDMTGSMIKLTKYMDNARNGSKIAVETFKELGIEFMNNDGTLKNAEQTWYKAIDTLGEMKNPADRNALALRLFGKSAANLNPLIKAGTKTLRELGEEAKKNGYIFSNKELNGMGKYDDMLQRFDAKTRLFKVKLGQLFMPLSEGVMEELGKTLDKIMPTINKAMKTGDWSPVKEEVRTQVGRLWNTTKATIKEKWVEYGPVIAEMAGDLGKTVGNAIVNSIGPAVGEGLLNALKTWGELARDWNPFSVAARSGTELGQAAWGKKVKSSDYASLTINFKDTKVFKTSDVDYLAKSIKKSLDRQGVSSRTSFKK